jgi:hypothetical protein
MTTENWLPVPGYEGHYEVSDLGRVRSLKPGRQRVLESQSDRGYRRVALSLNAAEWRPRVHQLVALAFLGPAPEGLEVCHRDGVRDNNVPSNLKYGTSAENRADAIAHGTHNMARKTHCLRGHEFTQENTSMIKLRTGSMARRCKACSRERARARRHGEA